MKSSHLAFCLPALCLLTVAAGCKKSGAAPDATAAQTSESGPRGDGLELLKKSMDRYQHLKSFSAKVDWKMDAGVGTNSLAQSTREFYYLAPNIFHASTKMTVGLEQHSVSDGVSTLEWSNASPNGKAIKYESPATMDKVVSMQMMHPMFCGTLLYQFFAGPDAVESLVDTLKGPITKEGTPVTVDGEPADTLSFYGTGQYGHTKVLVGEDSGKVYQISYDAEPLVEMMKKSGAPGSGDLKAFQTVEKYSDIHFDPVISKDHLIVKPPAGMKIQSTPSSSEVPAGPKVGTVAPEFEVTPVAGGAPVKLSSLKGKYVLLDFWATWCGPCKEGLPHTEALYKDFKDRGLIVMPISDEETDTISDFWKKSSYTMPVFRDAGHKAFDAYGANAIPELVLVDPEGKVAYSEIGLAPEDELRAGLAKAGLR